VQYLTQFDEAIRSLVKSFILYLPTRAQTPYIYADRNDGGIGLTSARADYALLQLSRAMRLLWSPCDLVSSTALSSLQFVVGKILRIPPEETTTQQLCDFLNGETSCRSPLASNIWMDVRMHLTYLRTLFSVRVVPDKTGIRLEFAAAQSDVHLKATKSCSGLPSLLRKVIRQATSARARSMPSQGKVMRAMANDRTANFFLTSGRYIRFKDYRFIHAARTNNLPVRAYARTGSTLCRRCGQTSETLPHVLNNCFTQSGQNYTARHDAVIQRVVNALPRSRNFDVRQNKSLSSTTLRPDLVIIDRTRREASVIDIAIPFENGADALEQARERKQGKYTADTTYLQNQGYSTISDAIIVGSLGTWDKRNNLILQRLGVSRRYLNLMRKLCSADVIQHSCNIYRQHCGWNDAPWASEPDPPCWPSPTLKTPPRSAPATPAHDQRRRPLLTPKSAPTTRHLNPKLWSTYNGPAHRPRPPPRSSQGPPPPADSDAGYQKGPVYNGPAGPLPGRNTPHASRADSAAPRQGRQAAPPHRLPGSKAAPHPNWAAAQQNAGAFYGPPRPRIPRLLDLRLGNPARLHHQLLGHLRQNRR
jgi:hypothetical protein